MRVNNIVVRRSNPTEEAAEWAATRLTGILEGWKKTVHLHSPAKGSPALVIALIPFAAIAEQTAKLRDPDWDGFKAIAGETRGAIGLAATWISDGLPNKREVNRRHEKTKKRIVDVTGFDPTTPSKSTTPPPA
ncbi:hypothetical protein [Tsukamurella tyrosinosolvens]|uniref:hypothetical protein n=1 Tax=Tsukamurella tyrosinosolvens TaxID=57704 RepID=UPI000DF685A2|nr:hypothetical protein [Tsukamurella tyrosinosolvens]RDB46816.1 hypothetical protein DVB87_16345 [Tsukamurella tyrosinosolvens]